MLIHPSPSQNKPKKRRHRSPSEKRYRHRRKKAGHKQLTGKEYSQKMARRQRLRKARERDLEYLHSLLPALQLNKESPDDQALLQHWHNLIYGGNSKRAFDEMLERFGKVPIFY